MPAMSLSCLLLTQVSQVFSVDAARHLRGLQNGGSNAGDCSGSSHDGSSYITEATCEASGICSDPTHNDQQVACLAAGTCDDSQYANKTACEAAGANWILKTWTGMNYTWNSDCSGSSHDGSSYITAATCEASGICSDPTHNDQQVACLAAGACDDSQYTDKTVCEAAGANWILQTWTGKNYTWNTSTTITTTTTTGTTTGTTTTTTGVQCGSRSRLNCEDFPISECDNLCNSNSPPCEVGVIDGKQVCVPTGNALMATLL